MNKSIAVIGLGRYGKSIATELYKNGADVLQSMEIQKL